MAGTPYGGWENIPQTPLNMYIVELRLRCGSQVKVSILGARPRWLGCEKISQTLLNMYIVGLRFKRGEQEGGFRFLGRPVRGWGGKFFHKLPQHVYH